MINIHDMKIKKNAAKNGVTELVYTAAGYFTGCALKVRITFIQS